MFLELTYEGLRAEHSGVAYASYVGSPWFRTHHCKQKQTKLKKAPKKQKKKTARLKKHILNKIF